MTQAQIVEMLIINIVFVLVILKLILLLAGVINRRLDSKKSHVIFRIALCSLALLAGFLFCDLYGKKPTDAWTDHDGVAHILAAHRCYLTGEQRIERIGDEKQYGITESIGVLAMDLAYRKKWNKEPVKRYLRIPPPWQFRHDPNLTQNTTNAK